MTVRLAVDAMGGDHAPDALVGAAVTGLSETADLELVLVGDRECIRESLVRVGADATVPRLEVVHASQVVTMHDRPVEAFRQKPDSSVSKIARLTAEGKVDGLISAGPTGAIAAACQLVVKPLANVQRAGIAVTMPSAHGPFVLCDAGANIQPKPRHLRDYAVMASLYARRTLDIETPRAALLSVGEEREKGTDLVRQTHELLRTDPSLNFVGNIEGRDLFAGRCDVAICDGFVGNIALKLSEGLSDALLGTVTRALQDESPEVRARFDRAIARVRAGHDYSFYGGAPLLGVNGVCVICHGCSDEHAVRKAIQVAHGLVERNFNEEIAVGLSRPMVKEAVS